MPHRYLKYFTIIVALSSFILVFTSFIFAFAFSSQFLQRDVASFKNKVPLNAFEQKKEAYNSIGEPVLALRFSPPQLRLPDLRNLLIYYGKNGRPDAESENPKLHFSLSGLKNSVSVLAGEKIYLTYDKKASPSKYGFSPDNQETNLWFVAKLGEGNAIQLNLYMNNENGEVISEPDSLAHFSIQEKEFMRFAAGGLWEIGKWRVDGTLLARQKARWFGPDCFLERHGGDEFNEMLGRQRIDFEEAEEAYSVFVKAGDCLVWKDNKWNVCSPSSRSNDNTAGLPIMSVKKIDDRIMNLELWDVEGKGRVLLNLIKSQENFTAQNIPQDFKFLGARTRTQCVFQVSQERMIVKPNDWMLLTDNGWRKITSAQEIDDYVNRKMTGTLFVFDEIKKKEEKPFLVGTVFNPSRTEMHEVEIAMQPPTLNLAQPLKDLPSQFDPKMQTAKMRQNLLTPFAPQNFKGSACGENNPLASH